MRRARRIKRWLPTTRRIARRARAPAHDGDDDDDDARERGAPKRGEAATAEATTDMTTDGERREIARGSPGMEATRAKGRRYYSLSCSTKIESLERRHFLGSIPVSNGR